jgi:hypothetical protein
MLRESQCGCSTARVVGAPVEPSTVAREGYEWSALRGRGLVVGGGQPRWREAGGDYRR